ncbi:MAG: zinc transporter ZupT [Clostridiaceae bacterium]|nr:zinc transporter ZupT [Clostridiales bacterium]MDD6876657.1 zinc transporter ZupT [Clostridiaceae bacterium]MDY3072574.1 zinc transporter ZupT [Eubacteriales bacterium]MDY3285826.1 zinc transporter ZupT [Eubacteriales bacterium]MDY5016403.1 zinc transporter ZupT [Eubacteriales bacterium]
MDFQAFWQALLLTLIAGLSTGIGGLFVLVKKDINPRFLSLALGFSAGVMIYISMTEMLTEAQGLLASAAGPKAGTGFTSLAFFGGMLFIGLIDRLVPDSTNPHELSHVNTAEDANFSSKLMRSGILTAIAIAIHNFPEGMATFSTSASDLSLGIPIAFAIAIHNIPEGIAVAAPIYKATGQRRHAFRWALTSGLAEPLGGLLSYLVLRPFMTDTLLGVIYAMVSGIMVFISFDELLPLAHEYGEEHTSIYGLIAGMAVMAISLFLFM